MAAPLIFRDRDFLLLWLSQVISQAGTRMFQIGLVWWILSSGSERAGLLLGIFMVVGALPPILAAKPIGKAVDRFSPRRILTVVDCLGLMIAVLLGFLFHGGVESVGLIMVAGFVFAILQAFIDPTLNKALPFLVARKDLESGVAFVASSLTLASFAGAVAGALVLESLGLVGVVLLNGATFLVSLVCDRIVRFGKRRAERERVTGTEALANVSLRSFFGERPLLQKLLAGFASVNFFGTPILVVIPIYTKIVLDGGAGTLSVLEAAVWLGMLSGTFIAPVLGWKRYPLRVTVASLASFCLLLGLQSLYPPTAMYASILFLAGGSIGVINVRMLSYFQAEVPDTLKGEFFATLQGAVSLMVPAGYLLFGVLADYRSVRDLAMFQALGVGAILIYFIHLSFLERRRSLEATCQDRGTSGQVTVS